MRYIDHSHTPVLTPATLAAPRLCRGRLTRSVVCGFVLALACPGFGQMSSVPDRVAQQNALFEEFYQAGLKNSPERATSFGDYRYNALLAQYSLAEIARQHAEAVEFLKRLLANSPDAMS